MNRECVEQACLNERSILNLCYKTALNTAQREL